MQSVKMKSGDSLCLEDGGISLQKSFDCGQCFRWEQAEDGFFEGVAFDRFLRIKQKDGKLIFENSTKEDIDNIWQDYFDLNTDYEKITKGFSCDEHLQKAAQYGKGIHILKQDTFEAVISFIISANNNIPRIKKIITLLCQNFGKEIFYKGKVYYGFPTAKTLAKVTLKDLEVIRAGFRAKYILDAAKKVDGKEVALEAIKDLSYAQAKQELLKIKGVGDKVADCVLLFGACFYEAFPKDVWIKRIMHSCYGDFECNRFGQFAGVAQQYLFYFARENKGNEQG